LQFPVKECFNLITETGVLHRSGAEKIPSNPNRIIPAWEVFEAARPSSFESFRVPLFHAEMKGKIMFRNTVTAFACLFRHAEPCGLTLALACVLVSSANGIAQTPVEPQAAAAQASPQTKLPSVNTTVVVHGETRDDYLPETVTVGTLDGATLQQAPLSATVVTRDLLNDQVARVLTDVVKNDASIGEDYAPVGYYGGFQIRGFPIDNATGLQINGLTIAGEQDVPLENKQSVEFLKGIAGVESGVASAGGLINYVTKKPAAIEAIDLATDHRGSAYGAADVGRLFGSRKQIGTRLNLAAERLQSYVNGADGWRAMGAAGADWKFSQKAIWNGNFEYQHKVQRSVSGYQLLGGVTVPDLNRVFPSTMLGEQSWAKPNTFDTYNTNTRLDYDLPRAWRVFVAGSFSHSLIDDNVVYAYGCYYVDACNTGTAPNPWFFAPDGSYDIYDYRNPGELRLNAVGNAMVTGHLQTGKIGHDITAGGQIFLRNVQMPGFLTTSDPYSPDGVVQDGAVFTYLGTENIYQPITAFPIEDPKQEAGPRRLYLDSHQAALILQDRIHLPGRIQVLASGRYVGLRDHNYSPYAGCYDFSVPEDCAPIFTNKNVWLPQYAITFNPIDNLTLYGNYGVMLSLGPQAPFWAFNGSQYLDPFMTRQAEVGAKYAPGQRILLTAAFFRTRAPFYYPKTLVAADGACPGAGSGDLCFESDGHETHSGVEINAEGKAARWLRLTASLAAIEATSNDTSTPAYNDKQVINVPRVRTALFADVMVPHISGLHLMPGWSYTGRKQATRDDLVSVPGYNLFNLGARYTPGGDDGHMTFRLYADNVADKRYWKDTGASYGDTFIHLGAPTTVRLSAHYTF
jgi:iron complex outermembrane receptor protein